MRLDRPGAGYPHWRDRIPDVFQSAVLGNKTTNSGTYEIATLKNFQNLRSLARDVRKPMFDLRVADGAIGSIQANVHRCYLDFKHLAMEVAERLGGIGTSTTVAGES